MKIVDLETIARMAEDKRVRIELLPYGFGITARAPVHGKGMLEFKQIISYTEAEQTIRLTDLFEYAIDLAIERLKSESRRK